jgi:Domain of unknown function (DUF4105)
LRAFLVLGSVLLAMLLGAAGPLRAKADGYLPELIAQARAKDLASRRAWLDLGHYRPDLLGPGHTSLIDSGSFFNAKRGKRDPSAELEATLAAFFAPPTRAADEQHPQCAFVARYRWLKEELRFDSRRLPEQPCPRFAAWRAAIAPARVTLVVPVAYLNNPSSMFGHTLLRLDRAGQTERTRLLSYAVNFGADVGDDGGLMFAVRGLTGGYRGTYSILPYSHLVRQYSDFENRDIWEYRLNLEGPELERLVAHLWELRTQHADYFFFDENCSYQLLFLLDVARPGLELTSDFPLHAIPVDTLRAVVTRDGLLDATKFRPSSRTRIENRLGSLSGEDRDLVARLSEGALAPDAPPVAGLDPARQAAVLEVSADFVTYEMRTGAQSRDEAAGRALALLAARSRIRTDAAAPPIEPPVRPDLGHGSARIGAGIGTRDGRLFQSLSLRPAYHDLADPQPGFVEGAEIDFLDLELRHYEDHSLLTLERLDLVRIRSFSPRSELIRPLSWQLGAGLDRFRAKGDDEIGSLVGTLSGGAGATFAIADRAMLTVLAEAEFGAGDACFRNCFAALGPAVILGWQMSERATLMIEGKEQLLMSEDVGDRYALRATQSLALSRNLALKLDLALEDDGAGADLEWGSSLNLYF